MTAQVLDVANPIHLQFQQRLVELEAALLAKDPLMPGHLAAIHKSMIQHEELVHLMTDDEIAKIMAAQQAHVNISLIQEHKGASGKAKAVKKSANISMDEL